MPYYEFVQNRGTESQSSEMLVLGTRRWEDHVRFVMRIALLMYGLGFRL